MIPAYLQEKFGSLRIILNYFLYYVVIIRESE
jgi:hypothetical protein